MSPLDHVVGSFAGLNQYIALKNNQIFSKNLKNRKMWDLGFLLLLQQAVSRSFNCSY
jgi:hypothetical protein